MEPTSDESMREMGLKNLGIGRKKLDGQLLDEVEVGKNVSVWDIYNEYSRKVDNEQIRDWNDTLNTLLIFAALYSGVLTAFIIESLTLIQEDPSETTQNILLHISTQLANSSSSPFNATSSPFVAPEWALRVNYCFFVSLSCSLVTALAAVLALQWVGSYDRGLNPSSVEQRALQRQFRREGAVLWKLEHIIASLPTLIFIALLIFFVGLAEWMWNVHHSVAIIVIVGTAIGALFYLATTLISVYSVGAPFRTPVSRYLPQFIGVALGAIAVPFKRIRLAIFARDNSESLSSFRRLIKRFADHQPWFWYSLRTSMQRITRFISPLFPFEPFESREIKAVDGVNDIKRSSLFWLSRIISIEPYQRQTFVTILQAILDMSQGEGSQNSINVHLWKPIFTVLRAPYNMKKGWKDYTPEELDGTVLIMRGLTSVRMGLWKIEELKPLVHELYRGYDNLDRMADIIASWQELKLKSMRRAKMSKRMPRLRKVIRGNEAGDRAEDDTKVPEKISPEDAPATDDGISLEGSYEIIGHEGTVTGDRLERPPNMVTEIYEYTLRQWRGSPPEFFIVSLKNLNSDYHNQSQLLALEIFQPISDNLSIRPDEISTADIVPLQVLDMLQELIIANLSTPPLPPTSLQTYLDSLHSSFEREPNELVISTYAAILEQAIANLCQINASSAANRPNIHDILSRILQMVQSTLWTHISEIWATPLLNSMAEPGGSIWDKENQSISANLLAVSLNFKWELKSSSWRGWWVGIMLGLDTAIKERGEALEVLFIKHGKWLLSANLPGREYFSDGEIRSLSKISHTGVRLFAMTITKSRELALSVLSSGPDKSPEELWTPNEAWTALMDQCYQNFDKTGQVTDLFSRAFAIGSSPELYDRIYKGYLTQYMKSATDLYQHLRSPVLPAVLRHSSGREGITWKMLTMVCSHDNFSSEFVNIDGLGWLHRFIAERPIRFQEAISFIYHSITKCHGYEDSKAWVIASQKCAESAVAAVRDGKIIAQELWQSISHNTRLLIDHLEKKPEETPVPASQSKVDRANAEGNLEGLTKKDDTLVNKEATQKDPVIQEWTQEEKEEFKNLVDKFTQEIYGILGHVLSQSYWWDESLVPANDLSLLRRLTMSQPHMCMKIVRHSNQDILSDSSIALNHFRAPVLERLLLKGGLYDAMRVLARISRHSWFRDEFIGAKGLETMPQILRPVYLEEAIGVVNGQLPLCKDSSSILLWVTFAWDCLKSVGKALSEISSDEDKKEEYEDMMGYARENLSALVEEITKSMNKWREERVQPRTSTGLPSGRSQSTQDVDSSKDQLQWSPVEWYRISIFVEELVPSIKRGYIVPTIPGRYTRIPRDPDGLCSHPHNHYITPTAPQGFIQFPRDPDQLCSLTPSVPESMRDEPTLFEWERMSDGSARDTDTDVPEKITDEPNLLGRRFPRDPDGVCSHLNEHDGT